jgi:hypothetical protein
MVNASFVFGKYFVVGHDFDHGILAHPRTRVIPFLTPAGVATLILSLIGLPAIVAAAMDQTPCERQRRQQTETLEGSLP